jgi:hypothetical protein
VNSKEKNRKTFGPIASKNSASVVNCQTVSLVPTLSPFPVDRHQVRPDVTCSFPLHRIKTSKVLKRDKNWDMYFVLLRRCVLFLV